MSAILAGLTGPVFGTIDQTNFYLDNISETNEMDETPLADGEGDAQAVAYHNKRGELSADFSVINATDAPSHTLVGHTFTISGDTNFGGKYIVKNVGRTRQRGQWMTGSLTASRFFSSDLTGTIVTSTL